MGGRDAGNQNVFSLLRGLLLYYFNLFWHSFYYYISVVSKVISQRNLRTYQIEPELEMLVKGKGNYTGLGKTEALFVMWY